MSAISKTFVGRYLIERLVAQGGTAAVHAAVDLWSHTPVALKTLLPHATLDPTMRSRLEREAVVLSRLSHPNIVELHAAGRTAERDPYLALEWIEGRSLFDAIHSGTPMAYSRIVHIALQIANAVRAVHRLGMIHRDLKPQNVMLMSDGDAFGRDVVKLIDFGICKAAPTGHTAGDRARLTLPGTIIGTPHYMAPEQIFDDVVDARTDVYSIGVILYEMITGTVPFPQDSLVEVMRQHATSAVPAMSTAGYLRSPPAVFEQIVGRCLAPEPCDRYPSIDELCRELEALEEMDRLPSIVQVPVNFRRPAIALSPEVEALMPAPRKLRAA